MFKSVDTKKYYNEDEFFKLSVRNTEIPIFFPTKKLQDLLPSKNDIKERTSSPDSTPTIITDIDNKYNKMIFELALKQGILDPRSANRIDWLNMGWMVKNQFDEMDMWDRFSERDEIIRGKDSTYKKQDIKDEWDKMERDTRTSNGKGIQGGNALFGSFIKWIKEDDKVKADIIIKKVAALKKEDDRRRHKQTIKDNQQIACEEHEKEWNYKNPNALFKFMTATKDADAGIAVFNHLKDRLAFLFRTNIL
jgi:hypothetical protein